MRRLLVYISVIYFLMPMPSKAAACFSTSSAQMIFGQYNPSADRPLDIDTTIEFNCSPAFRGRSLVATVELQDTSNQFTQSLLTTSGSDKLDVAIYIDSQRLQPAGINIPIPIQDINPDTKTFRVTLYGRIFENQKLISVGEYFGKFTLIITY